MPKGVYERRTVRPEDRFWRFVTCDIATRCWLWTGTKDRKGYGKLQVGTYHEPHKVTAPRFSFEMHHGPIPEGMHVLHRCDNPTCVSPDHLFAGSAGDNMADKKAKGRQLKGEQIHQAKLTESDVREIRLLRESGSTLLSIAIKFEVTEGLISRICSRHVWGWLD